MSAKPKIVCLCGSTRFWRSFMEWYGRLTDDGCVVLTIGRIVGKSEGELGEARKLALDELHLRKIDLADEVFVLDVGGYTGSSTKREIAHAVATGKPVRYLSHEFPEYVEPDEPEFMRAMQRKDKEQSIAASEPVSEFFELSYAAYLVWPRALMEAMPKDWQRRFVEVAREFDATFNWPANENHEIDVIVGWRPDRPGAPVLVSNKGYRPPPGALAEYRHPDRDEIEACRRKK